MKISAITSPTIASDNMAKSTMGMSMKGMEIASFMLRDKIYSNKPLAVVREYLCNAVDEHRKYNISKPVKVNLKKNTQNEWIWSVRDYAKGLDENGVRNIFGMYFESTKNEDNNSIGGFGVGSKAGHAYTDTFYVRSFHNGIMTLYACVLGAGSKGVPIGEIYAVETSPTKESGIEISLDVSKNYPDFNKLSNTLVRQFTNDVAIEYHAPALHQGVVTSLVPDFLEKRGGYIFNFFSKYKKFKEESYYNDQMTVCIRMGGIVYKTDYRIKNGKTSKGTIVVDVPIGALSIPISREDIEDTPANSKVYDNIAAQYDAIYEDERKSIPNHDLAEVIKLDFREYFGKNDTSKIGKWFNYDSRTLYPEIWDAVARIDTIDSLYSKNLDNSLINGKLPIYLFPDIKNQNNWKSRLTTFLAAKKIENYAFATNNQRFIDVMSHPKLDLTNVVLIDVKSLGLPKLPKNAKSSALTVYHRSYAFNGKLHTADELEAFVTEKYGEIDDEEWHTTVESHSQLNARTIGTVANHGRSHHPHWTANSPKMVDAMIKLGWIMPNSDEFKAAAERIEIARQKEAKKTRAVSNMRNYYLNTTHSPYLEKAIKAKPERLDKLSALYGEIIKEKSTRAKILDCYKQTWAHKNFTREDFRKILKLK